MLLESCNERLALEIRLPLGLGRSLDLLLGRQPRRRKCDSADKAVARGRFQLNNPDDAQIRPMAVAQVSLRLATLVRVLRALEAEASRKAWKNLLNLRENSSNRIFGTARW